MKEEIIVPKGIRYMLDWKEFELPSYPCIINKSLTGCGFTEFCLRPNPRLRNVILVSPRKTLLESKETHHNNPIGDTPEIIEELKKERGFVYYAKNDSEISKNIDTNLLNLTKSEKQFLSEESIRESIRKLRFGIKKYYEECIIYNKECKILVTYDSFRHVKEVLGNNINEFHVVVDEFQSIFTDSTFKADTEMEFINHLKKLQKVCFVSATPMLDRHLSKIDDFKDLPYFILNWEKDDPNRVSLPKVDPIRCNRILDQAQKWINKYKSGNFDKKSYISEDGKIQEIYSKELVIYVNSVSNICSIIKSCKLSPDECNILCANTSENLKKIKSAFKKSGNYDYKELGKIPDKGEKHKMFTFCTRTVYLGADFYSTCAQTIILSDANINCLSVDISLDLPQILGRQRLVENPWKNEAIMYFKTSYKDITREEFDKYIDKKIKDTNDLLSSYRNTPNEALARTLLNNAKLLKYRNDYVSVNKHTSSNLEPVFNKLVMISEQRAFEVQQEEFKNQVSIFNILGESTSFKLANTFYSDFLKMFESLTQFSEKMKFICEMIELNQEIKNQILDIVPLSFSNYYNILGPDICRKYSYRKSLLESEYLRLKNNRNINEESILENLDEVFIIGEKYTKSFIKNSLQNVFNSLGLKRKAKASDLEEWFELKSCKIPNRETGKRDMGFEIIKKK